VRDFEIILGLLLVAAVVRRRDENVIGQEALRRVQYDLDLDEIRSIDELPTETVPSPHADQR
jgi:hypothetical protein